MKFEYETWLPPRKIQRQIYFDLGYCLTQNISSKFNKRGRILSVRGYYIFMRKIFQKRNNKRTYNQQDQLKPLKIHETKKMF